LAGLRTAEDAARADALPDALDVQRALADQGIPEARKDGWSAADGVDPFAVFWADGNPNQPSECRLYFSTREGDRFWQLPYDMPGETGKPLEMGQK